MSRVVLDENVPIKLRSLLDGHDVITAEFQRSKGLTNVRLLASAEAAGFEVFITADQSLRFQQKVEGRSLAVIILSSTKWSGIEVSAALIKAALNGAVVGKVVSVKVGRARRQRDQ